MDDWIGLRVALVIVVWGTVLGGALLATLWTAFGGARAIGPEDEITAASQVGSGPTDRPVTSLGSAQVGVHGLLGIMTAILVTYAALRDGDRTPGYVALLVAIVVTAVPGSFMFWKWKTGQRPSVVATTDRPGRRARVEDRLPAPIVYLHGTAVAATTALVVLLVLLD